MKIVKITIAVLASFAVSAISFAGELTVTGSAKATYAIQSSDSATAAVGTGLNQGKGIGIANEFTLSASGETDQGIAWAYAQDIDGATVQDDAKLTFTMPTYGTVGLFVSEGGLSAKYKWNVTTYAPGSDYGLTGTSAATHDTGAVNPKFTNGDDIGGFNNVQYHTPSGLLPYGTSIKVAYAPNTTPSDNSSSNAAGGASPADVDGTSAKQILVETAPLDGLNLAASYFVREDAPIAQRNNYETYSASAKYAYGPVSVGYNQTHVVPSVTKAQITIFNKYYTNKAMGIGFNVNDNLSLSFSEEKSEANQNTLSDTGTGRTKSEVETTITALQAAYTMGGMTMSVSTKDIENMDYALNEDGNETVFAVSLAF